MRCRLAFSQTFDGRLLVTLEALWGFPGSSHDTFTLTSFDDENVFIQRVVFASFPHEQTIDLVTGVILAISGAKDQERWYTVNLSELQFAALGLSAPIKARDEPQESHPPSPFGFNRMEDLRRLFDEGPLPVCVMSGPEHTITYINMPYVRIIGRDSCRSVLDKPVREALPELLGQPYLGWLNGVYRTGTPHVGLEQCARLLNASTGRYEDRYFDFVYYPLRESDGTICGIVSQSNEVTEKVLERHVRDEREALLYRQWAELNALYSESPLGMCLVSAKDLTVLRANETKARLMGLTQQEIVGKKITDLFSSVPDIANAYQHAIDAKTPQQHERRMDIPGKPGQHSYWLWNLNPILDASGHVESVASIIMEIVDQPKIADGSIEAEMVGHS